jgi:hypothetical protein
LEPTNDDMAHAQSRGLDASADANPGDTRRIYRFYRNEGIALFMGFSDDVVLREPCNSKLVAGAGKRFESARRLTFSYE